MNYIIVSVILLLGCTNCKSSLFESDSCYSFGSGNVFPGGARKIDHKLQFTKAMSMYIIYCWVLSHEGYVLYATWL